MKKECVSILLEDNFRKQFLQEAIIKFKNQTKLAEYLNSKIKNRKIIRENIKEWLKGKHMYGWDILIPIYVLKELCSLNSYDLEYVLKKAVKFKPSWEDPDKKGLLIKPREIKISKKDNKVYLDLATVLPKKSLPTYKSKRELPLFTKINKTSINFWSEAGWKKSEIKLKRFVELNEDFFMGCAIYISEGFNKSKNAYNGCISLGNSEPILINKFVNWLDSFLKYYKPSCKIEYNGKKVDEDRLKQFWTDKIIKQDIKSINIRLRENYGSRLINNFGVFCININGAILKTFIINLLKVARTIMFQKKEWYVAYLKGLLACEGSVNTKKVLKQVTIGSTDVNERKTIKKILKKLNLNFCEGKNHISIMGWKSFFSLLKYDALEIPQINNHSKKERFLEGFKKHRKTQKLIRLFPFRNREFDAKDWQNYYNLKFYISSHNYLDPLVKENFLRIKFIKNKKYFYVNKGRLHELELIWRL